MSAKVHFVQALCTVYLDSCEKLGYVEWWHLMRIPKRFFILIFKISDQWYSSPSINTPFQNHKTHTQKFLKETLQKFLHCKVVCNLFKNKRYFQNIFSWLRNLQQEILPVCKHLDNNITLFTTENKLDLTCESSGV